MKHVEESKSKPPVAYASSKPGTCFSEDIDMYFDRSATTDVTANPLFLGLEISLDDARVLHQKLGEAIEIADQENRPATLFDEEEP
jgi:hypothetical protein